ncbi:ribosome biogenesis GTP-binding protein YihA/YsxC [Desulfovibrio inopinatus]|uniref:ribosome biogenesis GTP-binding protein YihA/YsxC n=1 Tax=Desulfovibrio inopinatus TaxID=102109 RepID=UPI0004225A76|nr:ribosome biogenesis GTP-binding protein YihA/YsxC [Desulfovibrio inopinatus]
MQRIMELVETVYLKNQLNHKPDPQIALAGRSNVGKSTLVNCLAGRKALAKTSATPGKTRSLNFYHVTPGDYYLVDLPGYGYAKCSKTEREKWARLIEQYFTECPNLKAVAVLLDSRLSPQKIDLELIDYLSTAHIPILPVLTKADKCKQRERTARQKQWAELAPDAMKPLIVSAKTGQGRDTLWEALDRAALI